jgi:hypothetical protein
MSIIDDLLKTWLERNAITLNGGITIALVNGGIKMQGEISSNVLDTKKNKSVATMVIPLSAQVGIGEIVVPVKIPRDK